LIKQYRGFFFGIIAVLFVCSLVFNIYLVNRSHRAEAYAMEHVYDDFRLADKFMNSDKQYSMSMLAEAGGTLLTLKNIPFTNSQSSINNNLFNVGYYLHSLATPISTKGMVNYVKNAEALLSTHIVKGNYKISYLNSDAKNLNQMLPKTGK
jgi:hypothetical protein